MDYGLKGNVDQTLGMEVRKLGFTMARFDLEADMEARITGAQAAGLRPFVIVFDPATLGPWARGVDIEFGNEPDGPVCKADWQAVGMWDESANRVDPRIYAEHVPPFVEACRSHGAQPWVGAVSNTTTMALDWLRTMLSWPIDDEIGVTVHRYHPPVPQGWQTPHQGYRTRDDETAAIKAIVGAKRWGCSEFGYHTAPQLRRTWLPSWWPGNAWAWTDAQVAANVIGEWDFWRAASAEFAVLYQINDGVENTAENRFGIRYYNDQDPFDWKPSAKTIAVETVGRMSDES
jgi:hypothetical protein